MPVSLSDHFALIEAELADLDAHPLAARQSRLVMVLLDKLADRAYFAWRETAPERLGGAEDIVAWRDLLRTRCPAMAAIFDCCALPAAGGLVTRAVEVPIAEYPLLSTADFMVSLYNQNTVQRVLLVLPGGETQLARQVIGNAMDWWRESGLVTSN
jgi:hypothetical protein